MVRDWDGDGFWEDISYFFLWMRSSGRSGLLRSFNRLVVEYVLE